jgi:hypothetical protein
MNHPKPSDNVVLFYFLTYIKYSMQNVYLCFNLCDTFDFLRCCIWLPFGSKRTAKYTVHKVLFRHHVNSHFTNTQIRTKNLFNMKYKRCTHHRGKMGNVDVSRQEDGQTDGKTDMAPPVRNSPTYHNTTPLPPAAFHFFEVQSLNHQLD